MSRVVQEIFSRDNKVYDVETYKIIRKMCNGKDNACKFYDEKEGCTKKRTARECRSKFLKNKE